MSTFAKAVSAAGRRTRGYTERLLKDVSPSQFARKPVVGGKVIDTNHPAFVLGHLALYPAIVNEATGAGAKLPPIPGNWEGLFRVGSPCQDDPEGKIYPAMAEITSLYFSGTDAILDAVAGLSDGAIARPTPIARYKEAFPMAGGLALFLLNNHVAVHMGQISAWRRCMGLGAV